MKHMDEVLLNWRYNIDKPYQLYHQFSKYIANDEFRFTKVEAGVLYGKSLLRVAPFSDIVDWTSLDESVLELLLSDMGELRRKI